jgi:hypothetical protein
LTFLSHFLIGISHCHFTATDAVPTDAVPTVLALQHDVVEADLPADAKQREPVHEVLWDALGRAVEAQLHRPQLLARFLRRQASARV